MTKQLELAFAEASKLPEAEQELLASRLLAELAADDDFDQTIARSTDKLAQLASEALTEHRAGKTREPDWEREMPLSPEATIERRLEAVELAVAVLQRKLESSPPDPNWLNQVIGSMKDNPAFLEALEYGREYRYSDRPSEDPEP